MPTRPLALCAVPSCGNLVASGLCDEHRREQRRDADAGRPSAAARGYDRKWRATRADYLAAHPTCECDECEQLPLWRRPAATDVDHIDGLGPNGPRGHDASNLQALTHAHHSAKTARHDGGFGRR